MRPIKATPIRPIDSKVIECDPVGFANWLNEMAELLNYTNELSVTNYNVNVELQRRVDCVEVDIKNIKEDIVDLTSRVENNEINISWLTEQIGGLDGVLGVLMQRLDWIYDHLPFAVGNVPNNWTFAGGDVSLVHTSIADAGDVYQMLNLVDDKILWFENRLPRAKAAIPADFKMAFGNINVMSANGGTASLNIGIFTKAAIENNDIYFN